MLHKIFKCGDKYSMKIKYFCNFELKESVTDSKFVSK